MFGLQIITNRFSAQQAIAVHPRDLRPVWLAVKNDQYYLCWKFDTDWAGKHRFFGSPLPENKLIASKSRLPGWYHENETTGYWPAWFDWNTGEVFAR